MLWKPLFRRVSGLSCRWNTTGLGVCILGQIKSAVFILSHRTRRLVHGRTTARPGRALHGRLAPRRTATRRRKSTQGLGRAKVKWRMDRPQRCAPNVRIFPKGRRGASRHVLAGPLRSTRGCELRVHSVWCWRDKRRTVILQVRRRQRRRSRCVLH